MLTADAFVDAMLAYVGIKEDPPKSNLTPIGEKFGYQGVPWCAETVSCAAQDVGFPLHEAAVGNIRARAQAGWGGMTWTDTPSRGAIVCWDFGGHGDWNDFHTGVVLEVLTGGLRLKTCEGNYSDRCDVWVRSLAGILGYALLPFDQPLTFTEEEIMDQKTEAAIIGTLSEIRDNLRAVKSSLIDGEDVPAGSGTKGALLDTVIEVRDNVRKVVGKTTS